MYASSITVMNLWFVWSNSECWMVWYQVTQVHNRFR